MSEPDPPRLVIGIGNEYRRDDAVGLQVARRLEEIRLPGVSVREASGEGAALMEMWKGMDSVIVIDAVQSGAIPGTIHQLEARNGPMPTGFFHYSTHAFGVAEAIELARALDQLPSRLRIYGIEGEQFDGGVGLSPAVEAAVPEVVRLLRESLEAGK
jgi:hydrogenase maturation protease